MGDNAKVLEEGKKKMRNIIDEYLLDRITEIGIRLLQDGVVSAKYHNVTGNTLTSLAVGIYYRGKLSRIITAVVTQGLKNPTRPKPTQRRRSLQRSVLHIAGLVTKDSTQQFFFWRRI